MGTLQSGLAAVLKHPPAGLERLQILDERLAPLAPILGALRANPDGQLLIAGGRASDYSPRIQAAPRVLLWESISSHTPHRRMPSNVAAVVFSRFLSHPETSALLRDAAHIGARFHRETLHPQTIALLAEEAGLLEEVAEEEPAPMPQVQRPSKHNPYVGANGKTAKGAMNRFLDAHAAPAPTGSIGAEHKRLVKVAREIGMPTTEASIAQGYRLWRNKRKRAPVSMPKNRTDQIARAIAADSDSDQTVMLPAENPAVSQDHASHAPEARGQDIDALLAMLDETAERVGAIAEEARTGLGLIREALTGFLPMLSRAKETSLEAERLRDKLERIAGLLPSHTGAESRP